jgi:hypothetical protein
VWFALKAHVLFAQTTCDFCQNYTWFFWNDALVGAVSVPKVPRSFSQTLPTLCLSAGFLQEVRGKKIILCNSNINCTFAKVSIQKNYCYGTLS